LSAAQVRPVDPPLPPGLRGLVRLLVPLTLSLMLAGTVLTLGNIQRNLIFSPLIGAGLVMLLIRFLPPHLRQENPLADQPREKVVASLKPILVFAALYPLLVIPVIVWTRMEPIPLLPQQSTNWILTWNYAIVAKVILLGVPTIALAARYGGGAKRLGLVGFGHPWLWLGTLVAAGVDVALNPTWRFILQHPLPPLGVDAGLVVVAFAFAGLPEELLFRVLLQTRLELLIGRWPGLALSSVLFGLMHFPSRYGLVWAGTTGSTPTDLIITLAFDFSIYVTGGLVFGYMWMRFRNAWIIIGGHTVYDAVALIGQAALGT
jgi:membrane protease YdiL (CAAX protease family)